MPVRNEADHLAAAVAAVRAQRYPGALRLFVAVAPSDDASADVAAALAAAADDVTIVANPDGLTPCGLNRAIEAGHAPVVVRVDGHSELSDGYVERAVTTMRATGAVNVGGRQVPVATTPFEDAVATATTSWLGTGGATYRVGGEPGAVDTVYLGVFDRAAIEAVGLFDERLVRNQDYELNIRLRRAGGTVWFDPELSVGYRPRGTWRALARQYYEYGVWKATVMRMYPGQTRLRQIVPGLGVATVAAATLLSLRRPALAAVPAAYLGVVAATVSRPPRRSGLLAAVATVTIHIAWSAGLLRSLVQPRPLAARPLMARSVSDHRWSTEPRQSPDAGPADRAALR